jgi:hypothetical protein
MFSKGIIWFGIFWAVLILAMTGIILYIVAVGEPRRNATLERRLAEIDMAQTVEDLRPLLREIVKQQRHDYR